MQLGITMAGDARKFLGLGDQIQLTSFPENFYRNTGQKVVDMDNNFLFDNNPYVLRETKADLILDIWGMTDTDKTGISYGEKRWVPSIAEKLIFFANKLLDKKFKVYLRHPRLYRHEDVNRINNQICVHLTGISTGPCPEYIADRIKQNYKEFNIIQIGAKDDKYFEQFVDKRGLDFWESANVIAESLLFIGVSSSMMNLASCYPRVIKKIILTESDKERIDILDNMMPMDPQNGHYHWLDWSFLFYNKTDQDVGVSLSYLKI